MHVSRSYLLYLPETKTATKVVQVYVEVYAKFGGSVKIRSENGTEFKNQLCTDVVTQLGVECKIFSPHHSQSNGRIEGFHNFLKAFMAKHISKSLEWN